MSDIRLRDLEDVITDPPFEGSFPSWSQTYRRYEHKKTSDRAQVLVTAQGLITENYERAIGTQVTLMVDGTGYFMLVGLRAGDIVTNFHIVVATAGTATSLSKCGLYTPAGVQLAASADQGTSWNSTGIKTVPAIAPYTVPADGGYFVCVLAKTATTMPTLIRQASNANLAQAIGAFPTSMGIQTGQADLPSPATIVAGSSSSAGFWVGIS